MFFIEAGRRVDVFGSVAVTVCLRPLRCSNLVVITAVLDAIVIKQVEMMNTS